MKTKTTIVTLIPQTEKLKQHLLQFNCKALKIETRRPWTDAEKALRSFVDINGGLDVIYAVELPGGVRIKVGSLPRDISRFMLGYAVARDVVNPEDVV
jgi:hypothetical protein